MVGRLILRLRDDSAAPAERNVSGNGAQVGLPFRSAGAMRNLLKLPRSINITSLRDGGTC
jgi:hypothetical protein